MATPKKQEPKGSPKDVPASASDASPSHEKGGPGEGGDGDEAASDASRDMQQQSKALDSITDHVEERQLDSRRVEQAMASIAASTREALAAQSAKEKELAAVRITPAHVDIIATELEVDKKLAEQRLREYKGDTVAAIRSFLQ